MQNSQHDQIKKNILYKINTFNIGVKVNKKKLTNIKFINDNLYTYKY